MNTTIKIPKFFHEVYGEVSNVHDISLGRQMVRFKKLNLNNGKSDLLNVEIGLATI